MKLTIVGCAGSYPGPESPASCYLLEAPFEGRTYRLLIDLGSGALGQLQRYCDLAEIDAIAISHMHADHCFDLSGLHVVAKYHPNGAYPQIPLFAPSGSEDQLASIYGLHPGQGLNDQFQFSPWVDGGTVQLGPFEILSRKVVHPIASYGMRITDGTSTLVYSADTGPTDLLIDLAKDADAFLCEASFVESAVNPPALHLTGAEAGHYAKQSGVGQLLVTHVPAWIDRAEVEDEVKAAWDGPYSLVNAGDTFQF
jgi:ribonuclease BN (tRNA processing enzyme)